MPMVGPRSIFKLVTRWPHLEELFNLPQAAIEAAGVSSRIAVMIASFSVASLDADWRWQEGHACRILTWEDADYPPLLKEIPDPPPVLYARGDLSCLQPMKVAMVGTRKPSVTGSETAYRFAFDLAKQQLCIVSGLALGIDAEAHRGCMDAKGQTIAVMGTGIDRIYPLRHVKLAEQISESGLLLSEFPLKNPPIAGHFPRRNRIISGLALCTLVVEAAIRSGSLITARFACEQNRDVMAIPGSIYNPQARGCHQLLQQGAKLVSSSQDVVDELSIASAMTVREADLSLASDNENLVKCMGFEITTVDQLVVRTGWTLEQVMGSLFELELQGLVNVVSGGYMRCLK